MAKSMIGSCLCGGVKFSVTGAIGPFELCHCNRCRKASGSAYTAALVSESQGFQVTSGQHLINTFEANLIDTPPPYTVWFCSVCGSHLPNPDPTEKYVDIPAGLLDDEVSISPDKHIYISHKANWDKLYEQLPQFTETEIKNHRELNRD